MTERDWQEDWDTLNDSRRYPNVWDLCKNDEMIECEVQRMLKYWLQRVRELETALEIMEKQLEIAAREITNVDPEYDTCPSEYDGEITCTCNGTIADVYQCWRERWKRKALAELEGDNKNA